MKNRIGSWTHVILAVVLSACAAAPEFGPYLLGSGAGTDSAPPLPGEPPGGSIYFLGNSMFKTGIDFEVVEDRFGSERDIVFSYHDGYYTGMWYAVARNSLAKAEQPPAVVVWGFRPTYAIQPAFRKVDSPDLAPYVDPSDDFYAGLAGIEEELPPTAGTGLRDDRRRLRDAWQGLVVRSVASALHAVGRSSGEVLQRQVSDQRMELIDVLVASVTSGEVQFAAERAIDSGDGFIRGPEVAFDDGFVPETARIIENAGVDQVVVIFRPVVMTDGVLSDGVREYLEAARRFFELNEIAYVDLTQVSELSREAYGKGDHYNDLGRSIVTEHVVDAVNRVLS